MASGHGVLVAHLLLLLLLTASIPFAPTLANLMVANEGRGVTAMKPMVAPGQGWMVYNETRRRLGSFQICALCTCCGGPKGLCIPSPCCYSINCNIPNRPFGYCSFIPKTCNCLGCHL